MRKLEYWEAISEGTVQCMAADPSVFVAGEGVDDPAGTYGTTTAAFQEFGSSRVVDLPNSEAACAGIAVGAAATGMRPLLVHLRADFMFLAMDGIINIAAKWHYTYGGRTTAPVVTRGVIGRGWGQGSTHSQSPHSLFGHFPGLHVATPATPADAKGMLVQALRSDTPVVLLENRALYRVRGEVPEQAVPVPFGRGRVARRGHDITVVAASLMVHEAERAADSLAERGISAEVIDLRSIRPLDERIVCESVAKTGRLVVADTSWSSYGVGAEVAAVVAEQAPGSLAAPVRRVGSADCPAPVSAPLEAAFHPNPDKIANACLDVLGEDRITASRVRDVTAGFAGPY